MTHSAPLSFSRRLAVLRALTVGLWLLAWLIPTPLSAQATGTLAPIVAPAATQAVTTELRDRNADGKADVAVETPRLRLLISGATGNLEVFYLRGINFEENLYPPVIAGHGYSFASLTMRPFALQINGSDEPDGTWTFDTPTVGTQSIVVTAKRSEPVSGLELTKTYRFTLNGYQFGYDVTVTNSTGKDMIVGTDALGGLNLMYGPGLFIDPFNPSSYLGLHDGSHIQYDNVAKFREAAAKERFQGVGLKTTYFCMLMDAGIPVNLIAQGFEVKPTDTKQTRNRTFEGQVVGVSIPPFTLKAGESRHVPFTLYYGPKLLDELALINRGNVTDYGFLSTMLLRILQFFHGLFPNFGLAIIFLTLAVRAMLHPLTVKQTKSMAQMQKIQPMLQDLKDRYRDNPQKFNEEVLKLYQKHNVNPLGGCLPLLLQLPILIALYNTINIAVELRKVPFLWLTDLSKADPYIILPLAITALMYAQQGQTTDPQQQQMMAFMPMFMFIITWTLPSGLLLYWFTSSVIGVVQQLQANKMVAKIKEE
ncbi:MAG TPA: membrane protein insertase YidC [Candidatus Ozemobacteraceae bacterium]|nr:membrane protein insertase YidC [Candidatus Ozemobacteraceae bacterium]